MNPRAPLWRRLERGDPWRANMITPAENTTRPAPVLPRIPGHELAECVKRCNTVRMKKRLPEPIRALPAVPKLVWLYIDKYPGQHSVRSLTDALGVHPVTALPELVAAGLLIEEVAPAGSRPGKYRTAELPDEPKPGRRRPAPVPTE